MQSDAFVVASASSMGATLVTNPFDVVKVRMQLHGAAILHGGGSAIKSSLPSPGVVTSAVQIVRGEGPGALWRGISMALLRAASYGGLRIGLYHPTKVYLGGGDSETSFGTKVTAGIIAGSGAAGVCSPLELLKTRAQSHPDHGHVRSGVVGTMRRLVAERGMLALWTGAQPAMLRGGLLTASQCACYEECKQLVASATRNHDPQAGTTHVAAAMMTGLVSTTVTNPADVLKSYRYMRPTVPLMDCVGELLRQEGALAFLKGWTASYARVGPHTVLILIFNEQVRSALDMDAF
eukprot:m.196229 g.196229  ORF g.196229 m.196229 type:complete len:293 (-) comp19714_c0_seq1:128-1006(-)